MGGLTGVGRTFFDVGPIGLEVEHFIFGEFVTGRAPAWPEGVPGGPAWAFLTGIVFLGTGAALPTGKRGRAAAVLAATLILVWAVPRHVPVVAAAPFLGGAWTRAGKALMLLGGALAVSGIAFVLARPSGRTREAAAEAAPAVAAQAQPAAAGRRRQRNAIASSNGVYPSTCAPRGTAASRRSGRRGGVVRAAAGSASRTPLRARSRASSSRRRRCGR